jgi:hypothetical protein
MRTITIEVPDEMTYLGGGDVFCEVHSLVSTGSDLSRKSG